MRARGNGKNGRHGRTDHVQVNAWRRGDVLAIAALRFGTRQLPATDEGRRFLRTLVALKFAHEDMHTIAPWWRDTDLVAADRRALDPDRVGNAIEFTFEELRELARRGYSVRHVAPFDVDAWVLQAFWREHRRDRDRKRKRDDRAKEAQMEKLPQRTELVRRALGKTWEAMSAIERRVAPQLGLGKGTLHVAVTREIAKLVALGMAEAEVRPGTHGMPTRMVRRQAADDHRSKSQPAIPIPA